MQITKANDTLTEMRTILAPPSGDKTKIQKIAFSTVEKLREGAVVAIGVENSYVALTDPMSEIGLDGFKSIKEYDMDYYFPLFVSSVEDLVGFVARISSTEKLLSATFWPGLLNIEFRANRELPHNLGAESAPATLVARKPKNLLLNAITDLMGPIIYTSLMNETGDPIKSLSELPPRIKKIITLGINSGSIKSHRKSTLISCVGDNPKVMREGAIPIWKVKKVVSSLQES